MEVSNSSAEAFTASTVSLGNYLDSSGVVHGIDSSSKHFAICSRWHLLWLMYCACVHTEQCGIAWLFL